MPGVRVVGPLDTHDRRGVIAFCVEGYSAQEVCRQLDERGVALRGGHHCAQPLAARPRCLLAQLVPAWRPIVWTTMSMRCSRVSKT